MALAFASSPPSKQHPVEAVFSPRMDTGLSFVLRCPRCGSHFGSVGFGSFGKEGFPLHRIVNRLNADLEKARVESEQYLCDSIGEGNAELPTVLTERELAAYQMGHVKGAAFQRAFDQACEGLVH